MFAKFSFLKYSIIYNLMGYHTTQFSLKQNKTSHDTICKHEILKFSQNRYSKTFRNRSFPPPTPPPLIKKQIKRAELSEEFSDRNYKNVTVLGNYFKP